MDAARLSNPFTTLSYQKVKDAGLLDADYVRYLDGIRFEAGIIGGGHDSLVTGGEAVHLKGIGKKTAEIIGSREFSIKSIGDLAKSDADFRRQFANDLSPQQAATLDALRTALKACYVLPSPVV